MILQPTISPLPFYAKSGERFENNPVAFGVNYPLICPIDELPTFFFFLTENPDNWSVRRIGLNRLETQTLTDITDQIRDGSRSFVFQDAGVAGQPIGYIRFAPNEDFEGFEFPAEGLYSLQIELIDTDTGEQSVFYYSEWFSVKGNMQNAIRIEYTNSVSIDTAHGAIPFGDTELGGFRLHVWVDALIGKPTYEFEENATRRMGYEFIESSVSKKTYRFVFIGPEYLCDAFRFIKICSDKTIQQYDRVYRPTAFNMNVDWQAQGDLAAVEVTFDTDNIMAVIGGYSNS